jgi:hypothetical protein
MAGFKNLRQWADAETLGQSHITGFRKAASSTTTISNGWNDYSYYPGSPPANFYASAPLEAAEVDADRGIYVPTVAPAKQFLRNLKLMSAASSATGTTNARQQIILCDILMYYPFIDTDAIDGPQDMINNITLPRYDSAQVIAVAQSTGAVSGQFTFTYTNQDGVAGRVSQNHLTLAVNGGGQFAAASVGSAASFHPFLALAPGDSGVKSIESVNFTVGAAGLIALVLVKPIFTAYNTQECRRTTSGNLESYGACTEFASVINHAPPEIKDGARLTLLSCGHTGSLASSVMVGLLETTWN